MIERAEWDALFVLHARSKLSRVADLVARHRLRRVLVLSSHLFFSHERAELAARLPADAVLEFTTVAAQLDDGAMAAIDADTTEKLLSAQSRWGRYADRFEQQARLLKNSLVLARLSARHTWRRAWADHGLGLHAPVWRAAGARPLVSRGVLSRWRESLLRTNLAAWLHRRRLPATATVIREGGEVYVFLSSLRRLCLREGTVTETLPTSRALALPGPLVIGTTIHDHPDAVARLRRPLRVFADGLLPSNYSRSYLDTYGDVSFVSADPVAARWFASCGRPVAPSPSFIFSPPFAPAVVPTQISTVVVLLGHAGDWTALINRSDNDALVEAVLGTARLLPGQSFVLRAHPTMEHPRHDGPGARARLAANVKAAALPNVSLSSATLTEDLARGDLLVSEYSATLIDAWRAGKSGLIANLTGRRSFMQDFSDLGFPSVSSVVELHATLAAAVSDPAAFATRQTSAALRWNALLES